MAITTTYTCDRCGHAQETEDQMWSVGLLYAHGAHRLDYTGASRSTHKAALWCRGCMQTLGILGPHVLQVRDETAPAAPAPPTLEDIIREMVREEIVAATGATS